MPRPGWGPKLFSQPRLWFTEIIHVWDLKKAGQSQHVMSYLSQSYRCMTNTGIRDKHLGKKESCGYRLNPEEKRPQERKGREYIERARLHQMWDVWEIFFAAFSLLNLVLLFLFFHISHTVKSHLTVICIQNFWKAWLELCGIVAFFLGFLQSSYMCFLDKMFWDIKLINWQIGVGSSFSWDAADKSGTIPVVL